MNEMEIEAIKTKCRRLVGLSNYLPEKRIEMLIEAKQLLKWLESYENLEGEKNG